MSYVPLHVHSTYSQLEGMITLKELVERASFLKFPAIALTDHLSTYGHYEFSRLAKEAGVKPILGVELHHSSLVGDRDLYHLTILAADNRGYRNLVSLVNKFYTKEREQHVTLEELIEHSAGLIALTGCLKGEVNQAILHGTLGKAKEIIKRLLKIFGPSNLYLEMMNHNLEEERLAGDHMAVFSQQLQVPLVVTNNDRYLLKEEGEHYDVFRALRSKSAAEGIKETLPEYYLKREKDLEPFFYTVIEAVHRSGEIAERCNVNLETRGRIVFSDLDNSHDTLTEMCHRRFLLKFHNVPADERSNLKLQINKELNSARDENLSDFLIFLMSLFEASSKRGIWLELVGSDLLESLIAYLLGIVPLNPVRYNFAFETFSSLGRKTLPALELFTSGASKERLIELIEELLPGYQPFFQVIQEEMSFQTIVKEVAEIHKVPLELRDELSKILAPERRTRTLALMLDGSASLRHLYNSETIVRRVLHTSDALRGRVHRFSQNTSRLVLLPLGLEAIAAYITGSDGERFVLLNTRTIEDMGGWVLGIQHSHFLSALEKTIQQLRGNRNKIPSLDSFEDMGSDRRVPERMDDPGVFALISSGDTTGVYLLESQGIRELLTTIKPSTFDELVNVISLYRPAPLEGRLWQRYIENAEKKGKVFLPHHYLAAALEDTRGLLLYREQVREILNYSAGLEGERAVAVANALVNRDSGELMAARLEYIRSAMDQGIDEENAQKIFDFLLHNISFTHSKALSSSQAYLSYWTAFFKVHLFNNYFLSLLNSNLDVRERQNRYLEYLANMGVTVFPVDVNASGENYTLEDDGIRMPLQSVKALERGEREEIMLERNGEGDFTSFSNFLNRMYGKISQKAVIGLINEGVFDSEGMERNELTGICNDFFTGGGKPGFFALRPKKPSLGRRKKEPEKQLSFFDEKKAKPTK